MTNNNTIKFEAGDMVQCKPSGAVSPEYVGKVLYLKDYGPNHFMGLIVVCDWKLATGKGPTCQLGVPAKDLIKL